MNLRQLFGTCLVGLLFASGPTVAQTFDDGGAALQGVLDFITIEPLGNSTVDVTTDAIANDGYWAFNAGGAGVINFITGGFNYDTPSLLPIADGLSFGIFDGVDASNRVTIYPPTSRVTVTLSYPDGSVKINGVDTGVDFSGNLVGFFVQTDGPDGNIWFSDTRLNSNQADHLAAYKGPGVESPTDRIRYSEDSTGGPWLLNEYIFGWEKGDGTNDYTDLVIILQSFTPQTPPIGSLGDYVWKDTDNNGLQTSTESGVGGVTVHLLDCQGKFLRETKTAPDGSYLFEDLPPSSYKVKFFAPLGYGFTSANEGSDESVDSDAEAIMGNMGTTTCIDLAAGETNLDVDAGLVKTASLGDFVWEDLNGNGTQDAGEPGINGVTVRLLDCDTNQVVDTQATMYDEASNRDGYYWFDGLTPGNYCVEFVLPDGFEFTGQDLGGDNTADSDADPLTGRTASTTLDPGESDPTWDAGILQPASLGDFVWNDVDKNGIQDADEPTLKDVLVELFDCQGNPVSDIHGNPIGAIKTDDNGNYLFENLRPGRYTVKFTAPDGYTFTIGGAGSDGTVDSDAVTFDGNMGTTGCVDLASGQDNRDVDAGLYEIAESRLGDFVWHDLNANGIQEPNEPGIGGVSVELFECDANGNAISTMMFTVTNGNGLYSFGNLTAGSYAVKFALTSPALNGYFQSPTDAAGSDDEDDSDADSTGATACVTLGVKDEDLSLDAGFFKPASLGDFVWFDANRNGVQDDGEEGVAGAKVELFDCDGKPVVDIYGNGVPFVITGADGAYDFGNLVPGGYTVKFTAPGGYGFTTANEDGSEEAEDSDAEVIMDNMEVIMGTTACITLVSGENDPDIDAGLVLLAECDLAVNATCSIVQQPVSDFVCKEAKPIDTLQMIWTGQDNVRVVAHYGTVSKPVLATVEDVDSGELVSISGFAGSTNDVEWEIFDSSGNLLGISRFHLSCSDSEMNGPEDCGLPAGNGKDDGSALLNAWLFEGMIGANGMALQCTPPVPGPGADSCTFTTPPGPHCRGKVLSMSLRYLGGGCTFTNTQEGKARCLVDGSAGEPVSIRVTDGGSKVFLDVDGVEIGDVVEASAALAGENELRSNTVVEIYSETGSLVQEFEMHTSCSKPLNLGDRFASVEVVGLNTTEGGNASLGAEVVFDYVIVNKSVERFFDEASDSFGSLGSLSLDANGGTASLSRTRYVLPDANNVFTNTLSVSGHLEFSGLECSAQDSVPVTREEPPAPQLACDEIKPITQLSMVWNGADGVDVLTEGGQFFGNVQNGNLITFDVTGLGNDVELTLSGAVTGMSAFHVSCSDDNMDGPEDCPIPQGNNKGDEAGLINDWGLEAMIGETGSFVCGQDNTGEVLPTEPEPGSGGGIILLFSEVDGNKIKMEMENLSGSDRFIESVDFVWPAGYELKKMKFDGDFLKDIDKTVYGTSGSIMLPEDKAFEDDPNKRKIKPGEKRKLEIEFDEDIEKAGLTLSNFGVVLTFSDGTIIQLN